MILETRVMTSKQKAVLVDSESSSAARERCYSVLDPKRIRVSIASIETASAKAHEGELKEISPTGAVLLLAVPPALKGICEISLSSDKLKRPIVFSAQVDWMRPNPAGLWQVGCVLQQPLAASTFKKLLNSGLLERRAAPREPVRIPVHLQLEHSTERIPAMVRNISEGGLCCLATHCPPQETRNVYMYLSDSEGEVKMPLKVRWSMQAGGDHFLGCQFVRQNDFATLRKLQLGRAEIEGPEQSLVSAGEAVAH
jgi:hypothetical protein